MRKRIVRQKAVEPTDPEKVDKVNAHPGMPCRPNPFDDGKGKGKGKKEGKGKGKKGKGKGKEGKGKGRKGKGKGRQFTEDGSWYENYYIGDDSEYHEDWTNDDWYSW